MPFEFVQQGSQADICYEGVSILSFTANTLFFGGDFRAGDHMAAGRRRTGGGGIAPVLGLSHACHRGQF